MMTGRHRATSARLTPPVAEFWYGVQPHDERIIRMAEVHVDPYAVGDIWLVRGSTLDVAIDTGSGIVPAGPVVQAVAANPVLAVALTCSYDHAGGWPSFDQRACHRLDEESLRSPTTDTSEILRYLSDDMFSAVPRPGYSSAEYETVGAAPTLLLADGEVIDLGDRMLEVIHTPGRSPGGLSLWEAETAILFSGEMLYDGRHGPAWPPDDPAAYCESLRRLRELLATTVHPGHYGSFDGIRMRELIDEQLDDLARRGLCGRRSR